jgi:predicted RNA-binding protein with RPS1 domain
LGIFLGLDFGISGLIHISKVEGDLAEFKVGDICKARIITLKAKKKQIGFSMKAPGEKSAGSGDSRVGDIVMSTVNGVADAGTF